MFNLDQYLAQVARRAKWIKGQAAWNNDIPAWWSIRDHAAELHFQSERGYIDVFPNEGSYEGHYHQPCPQLTEFACWVVAYCTHYADAVKWKVADAVYILTGRKSQDMIDWETAMAQDEDDRLLSYARG